MPTNAAYSPSETAASSEVPINPGTGEYQKEKMTSPRAISSPPKVKPDKNIEELKRENKELKVANTKLKHDLSNALTAQVGIIKQNFSDYISGIYTL